MAIDRQEFAKQVIFKNKGKAFRTTKFPLIEQSSADRFIFSRQGDRLDNLAYEFYGDPRYWWVIAWFNKKPTESHCSLGDIIRIPKPIGQVLTSLGY